MDPNTYLIKRIGTAKSLGFVVGLVAFFLVPVIWPGESLWLRFGVLMWYTTFGAMVGVLGLFDFHPMLKIRLSFWFRGLVFGAWFNFVLAVLMHDRFSVLLAEMGGVLAHFDNPFWIVAEGAVLGLLIDGITTLVAGEGLPSAGQG
jgi:hypothetical protein